MARPKKGADSKISIAVSDDMKNKFDHKRGLVPAADIFRILLSGYLSGAIKMEKLTDYEPHENISIDDIIKEQ